jgi:GTP-binding protein
MVFPLLLSRTGKSDKSRMKINSAEFVASAVKSAQYPPPRGPEIAFAGRSNVGKSSLMNAVLGRKNLVKTSSTPGRTQTINFFLVNERLHFVDLPGYGYAKVPKAVQRRWGPMVEEYLKSRRAGSPSESGGSVGLTGVVLILDIRRIPNDGDRNLLDWLGHFEVPACVVLTKADKLKQSKQNAQRMAIARELAADPASLILFSAKTGLGKRAFWSRVAAWL